MKTIVLSLTFFFVCMDGFAQAQGLPKYEIIAASKGGDPGFNNPNSYAPVFNAIRIDRVSNSYRFCQVKFEVGLSYGKPDGPFCARAVNFPNANVTAFSLVPTSFIWDMNDSGHDHLRVPANGFWTVDQNSGAVTFCIVKSGADSTCWPAKLKDS